MLADPGFGPISLKSVVAIARTKRRGAGCEHSQNGSSFSSSHAELVRRLYDVFRKTYTVLSCRTERESAYLTYARFAKIASTGIRRLIELSCTLSRYRLC